MTMTTMQQGAAATAQGLPAEAQAEVQAQVQREIQQAIQQAQQAARDAGQAQAQASAVVRGPDGSIIIRDGQNGESVVIAGDAIPPWIQDGPPPGVFMIPIALFASIAFVIVGLPIARAFARRMDRKGAAQATVAPSAELRQLQTSIDTMALEIERMSEHQRFLTRVLSEGQPGEALPARDASRAAPR